MSRPTRATPAGRAYLDLQNRARAERRSTQELLTLYVVERWLARLSASAYADTFVLKGGMLLAAFGARRATADADTLARALVNDEAEIAARVVEVAGQQVPDDGVVFQTETTTTQAIREEAAYTGVRVAMDCAIATATVKFRLDVNFGDPVTPPPQQVTLPSIRPGTAPVQVLGYPIETVLAEKIATALALGPANTRVRDYADIYVLTGRHTMSHATARRALLATAAFRGVDVVPLSSVMENFVDLRQPAHTAHRARLGPDGSALPENLGEIVAAVTAFADRLAEADATKTTWNPTTRQWQVPGTAPSL